MKKRAGFFDFDGLVQGLVTVGLVVGAVIGVAIWEAAQWAWPYIRAALLWVLQ